MQKTFILMMLVLLIVVIFAVQNPFPVYISLWFWHVEVNLSLLIIIAVLFGAFFSYLLSLSAMARKNKEIRDRDVKIRHMEEDLITIRKEVTPAEVSRPATRNPLVTAKKEKPE
jgi:lipopolysaccharide assembly protein A